jgi:hypothetical protein
MVGVAESQVAPLSSACRSAVAGFGAGAQTMLPPGRSEAISEPTRPWTWKKGMMLNRRSFSVRW